ncbi:MAG: Sec-independent protein translocase subunit TatA/TatB [Actinomycetota bacterium]
MFNIGPLELMLILIVALLVVGPKRLPEVGRSIGKGLREFRRAQDEVRQSLRMDLDEDPETSTGRPQAPRRIAPAGDATGGPAGHVSEAESTSADGSEPDEPPAEDPPPPTSPIEAG